MKRVDILNLECFISERNVIKKILSLLNEVDVELILCAHNTKRRLPSSVYFLRKCAKYGYTELLLPFTDRLDSWHKQWIIDSAAEGGHETFNILVKIYGIRVTTHHYCVMAGAGHLMLLKSFKPFGVYYDVCQCAAEGGHLDVLKYLKSINSLWDERVCRVAAKHGHFEILKWVVANGCPCAYHEITICAAKNGDLKMLEWAIDKGRQYNDRQLIAIAIEYEHIHILEWIRDHLEGINYIDQDTILYVVRKGKFNLLKWIVANYPGYLHRKCYCMMAAKHRHLEMLRWLRRRGCPWKAKKICILLARQGCVATLVWARDEGGVWTKACYEEALKYGHTETASMLSQNGLKVTIF